MRKPEKNTEHISQSVSETDGFLREELTRCFFSWKFPAVVCGIAVCCILGMYDELKTAAVNREARNMFSSAALLELTLVIDKFKPLMCAILASLFAESYRREFNSGHLKNILTRVSLREYISAKVFVLTAGVMLGSMAGFLLTVILTLPLIPVQCFIDNYVPASVSFSEWLHTVPGAVIFVSLLGLNFGLSVSALAVAGMACSVRKPEAGVAVGTTVVLFYFLHSASLLFPPDFAFDCVCSYFSLGCNANAVTIVLYHILYLGSLLFLSGRLFRHEVRRIHNG